MRRYLYNYQTIITFATPVFNHSVLLRCLPVNAGHQTVEEEHIICSPEFRMRRGKDAFGNRILYGGMRDPHSSLAYVSAGIVLTETYSIYAGGQANPIFLIPTKLTDVPADAAAKIVGKTCKNAMDICDTVHGLMEYTPHATDMNTPAAEVLTTGKGVCQDYAHLMIALCRRTGMPARYACGFIEGTGETHAWVEVFDGYGWTGYDPANGKQIEYGYVKLSHGRDAADCSVSRGLYTGATVQTQSVFVSLQEL